MKKTSTQLLLYSGILIPVIFWLSTFIAGSMHDNYNHVRETVSQLGAIGSPSEILMTNATWLCTLFSLTFFAGAMIVCRDLAQKRIPLVGILGFTFMFGWAAIFHAGNPMHAKGGASLLLILAGPLLALLLWKGNEFKRLRIISLISLALMLLILIRAMPISIIQNNYTGLIQRFVHLGWTVWFIGMAATFITVTNKRG